MAGGCETLIAKFDVASHPDNRPRIGMQELGHYFVDMVLPFNLVCVLFRLFSLPLLTWLNVSWFTVMAWTSFTTSWMTSLPLAHRLP